MVRPRRSGSVLVFDLSGRPTDSGPIAATAEIVPRPARQGQDFGNALALDGQTLVVGAPGDATRGPRAGAVFVFERAKGLWLQRARLFASDAAARQQFGYSVALDAEHLVIGAIGHSAGGRGAGAAYLYVREGRKWVERARWIASDAMRGALFGHTVALSGDTALVGANRVGKARGHTTGAAYIYQRGAKGWSEAQRLAPPPTPQRPLWPRLVAGWRPGGDRRPVRGWRRRVRVRAAQRALATDGRAALALGRSW